MNSQLSENVHIALKTELTTNKYITLISYPSWCLFARHVSYNFSHRYPYQLPQLVPLCWTCFIQLFPQIPISVTPVGASLLDMFHTTFPTDTLY